VLGRGRIGYCVATTVSWLAAAAVACGETVAQVTLPAALLHEYQAPPETSCTFTVAAAAGEIVNATASMFCGLLVSSVYETFVAV
jgi:hypothetical protein